MQGITARGWGHNWARLMGGDYSTCSSSIGSVAAVLWAVFMPHRRAAPWPPYCCPHLTQEMAIQRELELLQRQKTKHS